MGEAKSKQNRVQAQHGDLTNTPKAFANFSPGLERSDNLGVVFQIAIKP
jgi:hypothetical protein